MIRDLNITKKSSESDNINFKDLEKKCFVDVTAEIKREPVALSMGTYQYKGKNYHIPFGTYGNFSCLVGASKSMKTFLKSALVAGYIGGQSQHYFPTMRGHDIKDKFILDFDTEQSLFHVQKVAQRSCEMVGSNYEFYRPYCTREEDPRLRFQFIEYMMLESEFRNNIGLVMIDGAADILESVNDLDISNKIVQGMMNWSSVTNSHISTVLHRNHKSDKPTGHLGSAIMKKAETVAFVTKSDGVVNVTPEYTRNYPFNEFSFELDENFLPREVSSEGLF